MSSFRTVISLDIRIRHFDMTNTEAHRGLPETKRYTSIESLSPSLPTSKSCEQICDTISKILLQMEPLLPKV